MTPEQFCYWLQGRAETQPNNRPSNDEWKMIVDHLQSVFKKETKLLTGPLLPNKTTALPSHPAIVSTNPFPFVITC